MKRVKVAYRGVEITQNTKLGRMVVNTDQITPNEIDGLISLGFGNIFEEIPTEVKIIPTDKISNKKK